MVPRRGQVEASEPGARSEMMLFQSEFNDSRLSNPQSSQIAGLLLMVGLSWGSVDLQGYFAASFRGVKLVFLGEP